MMLAEAQLVELDLSDNAFGTQWYGGYYRTVEKQNMLHVERVAVK